MATKGKASSKGGSAKSGKGASGGGGGKGGGSKKGAAKGSAKGSAKSAKKGSPKVTVNIPAKGGSKGAAKGSGKGAAKGSAKGAAKGAAKASANIPAKGSAKGSSKSAGGGLGSTAAWTGTPTTLTPQQNASLSQTPNGTLIFAYQNNSTTANAGRLSLSSGSSPQLLDVPALTNQPLLLIKNFKGSNLSVSNVSQTSPTPIMIEAVGPGLPGLTPTKLPMDGTVLQLVPYGAKTGNVAAQGNAPSQSVVVSLQANSGQLTILAIQVGNNAMVIALNAAQESGPGSDSPDTAPPAGYFATTTGNNYQNIWNWGASAVFVVNMSPSTAAAGSINLIKA
jgi:hypothetical protein